MMANAREGTATWQHVVPSDMASDEMNRLLGSLPQGIYDKIYELVFTIQPGVRHITLTYKPPAQLQVSRATRIQYALKYFSQDSEFQITASSERGDQERGCTFNHILRTRRIMFQWAQSLEKGLMQRVATVTVVLPSLCKPEGLESSREACLQWVLNFDVQLLGGRRAQPDLAKIYVPRWEKRTSIVFEDEVKHEMATTTVDASDDHPSLQLQRSLDNLPRELYDYIYNLVFSVGPSVQWITLGHKPPVQASVSRATRAQFLPDFYRRSSFHIFPPWPDAYCVGRAGCQITSMTLRRWVDSVDSRWRSLIGMTAVVVPSPSPPELREFDRNIYLRALLNEAGLDAEDHISDGRVCSQQYRIVFEDELCLEDEDVREKQKQSDEEKNEG